MTSNDWQRILRAVKAGRNAAFLGPRTAAQAAAAELLMGAPASGDDIAIRIATAAVLASQGAKHHTYSDVRTFWRELETDDAFRVEMVAKEQPILRRSKTPYERPERLPVESARAVPILEIFARYGHELRRAGVELVTQCPFHDDRRPSLRVNAIKGRWYCDVCGIGGDGIGFVMQRKGLDFAGAVREVAA